MLVSLLANCQIAGWCSQSVKAATLALAGFASLVSLHPWPLYLRGLQHPCKVGAAMWNGSWLPVDGPVFHMKKQRMQPRVILFMGG